MRFHKDVEYALISLATMMNREGPSSARELSELHQIPYGLLCKILQRLAAGDAIESIQGPRGGYRLSRNPYEITLGEIMALAHGEQHVAACLDRDERCDQSSVCSIRGGILMVQTIWDTMVSRMTLADFLAARKQAGSHSASPDKLPSSAATSVAATSMAATSMVPVAKE